MTLLWRCYDSYCNYCHYCTILSSWSEREVSMAHWRISKEMQVWATHLGYHAGEESRRRSGHLVLWMKWTWSSAICDERPCLPATQTCYYSGSTWSQTILGGRSWMGGRGGGGEGGGGGKREREQLGQRGLRDSLRRGGWRERGREGEEERCREAVALPLQKSVQDHRRE